MWDHFLNTRNPVIQAFDGVLFFLGDTEGDSLVFSDSLHTFKLSLSNTNMLLKSQLRNLLLDYISEGDKLCLISLKPQFFQAMLEDHKHFEYRKSSIKTSVDKVFLYVTSPVMKIQGYITIDKVIVDSPKNIWEQTKSSSGISQKDFFAYCSGKQYIYAHRISKFSPIEEINPYIINKFKAPQSLIYF